MTQESVRCLLDLNVSVPEPGSERDLEVHHGQERIDATLFLDYCVEDVLVVDLSDTTVDLPLRLQVDFELIT